MNISMLKVSKMSILAAAMLLIFLTACQNEVQTANSQADTPSTIESETSHSKDIEIETQSEQKASNFSEFENTLQGTWERTTYPYDTIEFQNNRVKFTQGEGAIEPAKFESFELADECPATIDTEASALAYDYLVIGQERCDAIKLDDNLLSIIYSGVKDNIEYKKLSANDNQTTSMAQKSIPANFYGKWASSQQSCAGNNAEQLQISANKLSFFENQAELVAITQFEPTRIEGKFNYLINNSSTPYSYSLDLQNQEKVLIMRENGKGARPGPIKYEKCL